MGTVADRENQLELIENLLCQMNQSISEPIMDIIEAYKDSLDSIRENSKDEIVYAKYEQQWDDTITSMENLLEYKELFDLRNFPLDTDLINTTSKELSYKKIYNQQLLKNTLEIACNSGLAEKNNIYEIIKSYTRTFRKIYILLKNNISSLENKIDSTLKGTEQGESMFE